jgi:tRNA modification GTPase
VLIARARQRAALVGCAEELRALSRAFERGGEEPPIELQAEHLRLSLRALGRVVGEVDVEEVLGEIFANFCVGK